MPMKTFLLACLVALAAVAVPVQAQNNPTMGPGQTPVYAYDQRPLAGLPVLIDPQQAQVIVEEFKSHYPALGNPRILVYVHADSTGTNHAYLAKTNLTEQVQRLVARPLRIAGASLVDLAIENQANPALRVSSLLQNEHDRDHFRRIADVVIEAHVSSRTVTVNDSSGPKTLTVPELQLTALRLSDAKIIGQISASDLLSRAGGPGYVARNFNVRDVAESTALALMDATLRVGN
jgi:hypothetical protein